MTEISSRTALIESMAQEIETLNIKELNKPVCCSGFDSGGQAGCGCYGISIMEEITGRMRVRSEQSADDVEQFKSDLRVKNLMEAHDHLAKFMEDDPEIDPKISLKIRSYLMELTQPDIFMKSPEPEESSPFSP